MLPITNAMLERILNPSSSCLPSITRISLELTCPSLGATKCSFSSSEEASLFLLSRERLITKITKLFIVHHWGKLCENDTETQVWSNQYKSQGDHEWKLYASGRLMEQYYYIYEDEAPSVAYGTCPLSPLLAASIIQEAGVGPIEDLFECAVRKTDRIMEERQTQCRQLNSSFDKHDDFLAAQP